MSVPPTLTMRKHRLKISRARAYAHIGACVRFCAYWHVCAPASVSASATLRLARSRRLLNHIARVSRQIHPARSLVRSFAIGYFGTREFCQTGFFLKESLTEFMACTHVHEREHWQCDVSLIVNAKSPKKSLGFTKLRFWKDNANKKERWYFSIFFFVKGLSWQGRKN